MTLDNVTDLTCTKTLQLPAGGLQSAGVNPATYVSYGINGAWAFAKSITEVITGAFALPFDMNRSETPFARIGWASAGTTGVCKWQLEYLYVGVNDNTIASAQDTVTIEENVSAIVDGYQITNFTLQKPDATDRILLVKLSRLGGADTLDDTANVIGLVYDYKSDKLGVP